VAPSNDASRFALTSTAFTNGAAIPARFTCDGEDLSPALSWSGAPKGTATFALVVEDPDAPGGTFIHWVLYDLPATTNALAEGMPKDGSLAKLGNAHQGRTSFKALGYGGPCPPKGPAHRYYFRLYALDAALGLPVGATRDEVVAAMRGHELAKAELMGTYARR